MQQINIYEQAQDDLDRLFKEGRHAPEPQTRDYRPGENRAQRRRREREERRAKKSRAKA